MQASMRVIVIAGAIQLAVCTAASGQAADPQVGATPAEQQTGADVQEEGGFGLHYQVGAMKPVASSLPDGAKADYVITADLLGLNWSRTRSSWGAGVRFAFTDNGNRLGLKGLWRTPLKQGTWSYLQVAIGLDITASDVFVPKTPGIFLEGEVGLAREFALVLVVEAMAYEDLVVGYDPGTVYSGGHSILENGTAISLQLGARVGQVGAAALTVIGLVAGLIAAASIGSSGGFI